RGASRRAEMGTGRNHPPRPAARAASNGKLQMPFYSSRLPGTATQRACCFSRTGRAASSLAYRASMHSRDGDVGPDRTDRFVKADRDRILQIQAAFRGLTILPGKNIFEDFAEIALV